MKLFIDRRFRTPRIWSNDELKKFAYLFKGDIINVSGWTDEDKEGDYYSNYFINAISYTISNYDKEKKGMQGLENEIYLDLEKNLAEELVKRFDVVFNHTTLEHIYNTKKAFENLCTCSRDIVILVVPFMQQNHGRGYGDYWRFSPLAIKELFEKNKFKLIYLSANNHNNASVYLFAIGSINPERWKNIGNYERYANLYDSCDWGSVGENVIKDCSVVSFIKKAQILKWWIKKND
jgi:hypothetical protein